MKSGTTEINFRNYNKVNEFNDEESSENKQLKKRIYDLETNFDQLLNITAEQQRKISQY